MWRFSPTFISRAIATLALITWLGQTPVSGQGAEPRYETSGQISELMNLDPSALHAPLIPTPAVLADTSQHPERFEDFYELLKIHANRYGVDDNFTLRVMNRKTGELLEVHVMEAERDKFMESGSADWGKVDARRRKVMKRLLDQYERAGHRRRDLTVTWGRLNQVFEARHRDEPYLSYELRLAKMHGLSALSTELGTVETFNQDWLVSRAGARGRYQFMPHYLRRFGIRRYSLKSTTGSTIRVYEERHPLLTMEHSFEIIRAYANAVGHEIPGLSAYNTGVGNIFNVGRMYLMSERPNPDEVTIFDAYSWAVTDGFPTVSRRTTFRRHSRAYLPSVIAAYRASEHLPVRPEQTMKAELVVVQAKQRKLNLKDLLSILEKHDLDWTPWQDESIYSSFRSFNQHVTLPKPTSSGAMPRNGNLVIYDPTHDGEVRLFLPLGASEVLEQEGVRTFDPDRMRRFDDFTYQDPATTGEKSLLDWEYEALVEEIGRFGYTMENRERVNKLAEQFAKMAEDEPTPYRNSQALISEMHRRLWSYGPWVKLEKAVAQTRDIHEVELRQGSGVADN